MDRPGEPGGKERREQRAVGSPCTSEESAQYQEQRPDEQDPGDRTGQGYRLGDDVTVRLVEAIPTAGALRFEMLSPGKRQAGASGKLPRGRNLRWGRKRLRS